MGKLIKEVELMMFNAPLENSVGHQYNMPIEAVEREMQKILNFGSIGFVTFCQVDDLSKGFLNQKSAGYLQGYELVRNIHSEIIWLYADIVMSPEAIGFQNLFPDLAGFAMRSMAREFETDYGRIAQLQTISGFDYTFIQ